MWGLGESCGSRNGAVTGHAHVTVVVTVSFVT